MRIDIDELEREATHRTGLDDFGSGEWRGALRRLLDAVDAEAGLSEAGYKMVRGLVLDRLVNRLEIGRWVADHPSVRSERVEAPLILATLPRTGQTALGWILDRDPSNRSLLTWFAKRPCPPPLPGSNEGDPRIDKERAIVRFMPKELLDMHLSDAEEPDECHWLLSNDFKTPHEIYAMRVPSYYRWVRSDPGIADSYQYYKLQLQILQSRTPGRRWVLKNSPHLLYLEALDAALPDAIYVQSHRDPLKVLASNCRLAVLLRSMACDDVDPHEVGASMLQLLRDYLDGLLRFREGTRRRWIDLRFSEFVADPLGGAEKIYAAAGIDLASGARRAMAAWVETHPRKDLSRARPADLSPYGIDRDEALTAFAEYSERFDVAFDGV